MSDECFVAANVLYSTDLICGYTRANSLIRNGDIYVEHYGIII